MKKLLALAAGIITIYGGHLIYQNVFGNSIGAPVRTFNSYQLSTTTPTDNYILSTLGGKPRWIENAGGSSVQIDSVTVSDPNFVSTGDIDFVDTSGTITANINSGAIVETDFDLNAPVDNYLLVASSTASGGFEWVATSTERLGLGGGGASVGGSDGYVQYNDGGVLNGATYLRYDDTNGRLYHLAARSGGQDAIFIGDTTGNTPGAYSVTIAGRRSNVANIASGAASVAIGANSKATGQSSVAIGGNFSNGLGPDVTSGSAVGIGSAVDVSGDSAIGIGVDADSSGFNGVSLGAGTDSNSLNAVALGAYAQANFDYAVAIGAGVAATQANQIRLGDNQNSFYPNLLAADVDNAVIGDTTQESSAILKLASTVKGFLTTVMTSAQRDAITSPATGLNVYNSSSSTIDYYDGTNWTSLRAEFPLFGTTFASSSLAYDGGFGASGTTTESRAGYKYPVTVTEIYCKTDTGTTLLRIGDGTNWSETLSCSSSGATQASPSNGTFTAREDIQIQVGTSASSPNKIYLDVTGRWSTD